MSRIFVIVASLVALAGCQKIARYPAAKGVALKDRAASPLSGWIAPTSTPREHTIEFVTSDKPEWRDLAKFWNQIPLPLANAGNVKVKVPLGLPDPTPLIPAANPPTVAKWQLGRKIFFEHALTESPKLSCASCHKPTHGFTEGRDTSDEGQRNTLSLLNVAYNRDQFWDGRVGALEETLVHSIDAGDPAMTRGKMLQTHQWPGLADRLDKMADYRKEFSEAFGIDRVTQDAVAKALATYLRTILSGNSVYDQARAASPPSMDPTVEQFKAALTDDALKRLTAVLPAGMPTGRDELAAKIAHGQTVFLGKGGCVRCHTPGLFTNHQFYNTLIAESGHGQGISGRETGRFAVLPIGLKDFSLRGAYRTPTLRNLSATAPYMHNGHFSNLSNVVEKYAFTGPHPLLAQPLRDWHAAAGPDAVSLIDQSENAALVCFLLALDGEPIDSILTHR